MFEREEESERDEAFFSKLCTALEGYGSEKIHGYMSQKRWAKDNLLDKRGTRGNGDGDIEENGKEEVHDWLKTCQTNIRCKAEFHVQYQYGIIWNESNFFFSVVLQFVKNANDA